jgi:type IV fimbrial biogenesis protein FimT
MTVTTQRGFTLVELLATVAVSGLLLSVAVPSYRTVTQENRSMTVANDFLTALAAARAEAIRRGGQVTVEPAGEAWERGWQSYFDRNRNENFDDDGDAAACEADEDCLLLQAAALPGGLVLRAPEGGEFAAVITFDALGAASGDGAGGSRELRLCGTRDDARHGRTLSLSVSGRVQVGHGVAECP